jgi:hypothetical protein
MAYAPLFIIVRRLEALYEVDNLGGHCGGLGVACEDNHGISSEEPGQVPDKGLP